jgi:hypothetical protein
MDERYDVRPIETPVAWHGEAWHADLGDLRAFHCAADRPNRHLVMPRRVTGVLERPVCRAEPRVLPASSYLVPGQRPCGRISARPPAREDAVLAARNGPAMVVRALRIAVTPVREATVLPVVLG